MVMELVDAEIESEAQVELETELEVLVADKVEGARVAPELEADVEAARALQVFPIVPPSEVRASTSHVATTSLSSKASPSTSWVMAPLGCQNFTPKPLPSSTPLSVSQAPPRLLEHRRGPLPNPPSVLPEHHRLTSQALPCLPKHRRGPLPHAPRHRCPPKVPPPATPHSPPPPSRSTTAAPYPTPLNAAVLPEHRRWLRPPLHLPASWSAAASLPEHLIASWSTVVAPFSTPLNAATLLECRPWSRPLPTHGPSPSLRSSLTSPTTSPTPPRLPEPHLLLDRHRQPSPRPPHHHQYNPTPKDLFLSLGPHS
ncbi:vegetative cell wall protein gp1-like [Setaria italica]|uniref:vegetative cell wall protein gp1-like n=1 Tax=Setaria italica TaxID=4555 RepID=UPI000351142D|nr:vegetative cell wall protein gp1-like [Setaria italica]